MTWHDVWPKQRANVRRKKLTPEDIAYRARVRKNKTKAAVKASNARIAAERAERAKLRRENAEKVRLNEAEDRRKRTRDERDGLNIMSASCKKRLRLV